MARALISGSRSREKRACDVQITEHSALGGRVQHAAANRPQHENADKEFADSYINFRAMWSEWEDILMIKAVDRHSKRVGGEPAAK
jgi:hypothetical protein